MTILRSDETLGYVPLSEHPFSAQVTAGILNAHKLNAALSAVMHHDTQSSGKAMNILRNDETLRYVCLHDSAFPTHMLAMSWMHTSTMQHKLPL